MNFMQTLFSKCTNSDAFGVCRSEQCNDITVQYGKNFFIRFGHAGFNSPSNNRGGYSSAAAAMASSRRYATRGRNARGGAR